MAQQQAMFMDLIASMKRATARHDDASDSDDSISHATNRTNKLKRKAKYVQEGHLSQADGPRVYKRKLNYNGYTRNIISKNTARVDPDGDLIEDDEHSDPDLSPAEDDPYSEIKLESADLDKHPSMSVPYTSRILDEMVQDVQDMVHREEAALWRVKNQLVQFRGDDAWAPCGMFETENDLLFFQSLRPDASVAPSVDLDGSKVTDDPSNWDMLSNPRIISGVDEAAELVSAPDVSTNAGEKPDNTDTQDQVEVAAANAAKASNAPSAGEKPDPVTQPQSQEGSNGKRKDDEGGGAVKTEYDASETVDGPGPQVHLGNPNSMLNDSSNPGQTPQNNGGASERLANGNGTHLPQAPGADKPKVEPTGLPTNGVEMAKATSAPGTEAVPEPGGSTADSTMDVDVPANDAASSGGDSTLTHRMTTRARAQALPGSARGGTPGTQDEAELAPTVHPFFLAPPESMPFPTQGLGEQLANDVRLALSAYVQRQEEVVRQCNTLLDGLRKAQRMRKTVWSWCRNEGHLGEMSDGEDWIDMEEWGLEEPLKKGEEVEDEEVAVGLTKKTRNRRSAA